MTVEQNDKAIGEALYMALAKRLIGRILEADAKCDPPFDVDLRLASIIAERDELRASKPPPVIRDHNAEIGTLQYADGLLDDYGYPFDSPVRAILQNVITGLQELDHPRCEHGIRSPHECRDCFAALAAAPQAQAHQCIVLNCARSAKTWPGYCDEHEPALTKREVLP